MASVAMEVTLDSQVASAAMRRLAEFGDDRAHAMWDAIGAAMVSSTQLRFREQHGPDGEAWKPSQRVVKHGGATLIEHGYLLASQTHNVLDGNEGVEWGSALVYAAIHQTGGEIHRQAHEQHIFRKLSGKKPGRFAKESKANFGQNVHVGAYDIHIPARPYLGIDAADEVTIEGIAQRHLEAALLGTSPGTIQ